MKSRKVPKVPENLLPALQRAYALGLATYSDDHPVPTPLGALIQDLADSGIGEIGAMRFVRDHAHLFSESMQAAIRRMDEAGQRLYGN